MVGYRATRLYSAGQYCKHAGSWLSTAANHLVNMKERLKRIIGVEISQDYQVFILTWLHLTYLTISII